MVGYVVELISDGQHLLRASVKCAQFTLRNTALQPAEDLEVSKVMTESVPRSARLDAGRCERRERELEITLSSSSSVV